MAETFERFIARERTRLTREREKLVAQQGELEGRIEALDRELKAIEAYVDTKEGSGPSASKRRSARRRRRSPRRDSILAFLKENGALSRGELLEKMGLKGDKAGEQSVSNALSALKKAGAVLAKDRKYRVAA